MSGHLEVNAGDDSEPKSEREKGTSGKREREKGTAAGTAGKGAAGKGDGSHFLEEKGTGVISLRLKFRTVGFPQYGFKWTGREKGTGVMCAVVRC
jgi:hypothetical protein